MDRGDILAKLQSTTSAAETRTLSITDASMQTTAKTDNTKSTSATSSSSLSCVPLNALDSPPSIDVFKLISSASDLEQQLEFDKMPASARQAIINKFLSSASSPLLLSPSHASLSTTTSVSTTDTPISISALTAAHQQHQHGNDAATAVDPTKIESNDAQSALFDAQITTKNKRKNFKPRSAAIVDDDEPPPPPADQILLNLMMQSKMKMFQQEFQQSQYKRMADEVTKRQTTDTVKPPKSSSSSSAASDCGSDHHSFDSAASATNHQENDLHRANSYNAFNAVQELLAVYGLSMTPNDIVDAFAKKSEAASNICSLANSGKSVHFFS